MNSTFKSWLIANFEIFATAVLAVIFVPSYAIFIGDWQDMGKMFMLVLIIVAPAIPATVPKEGVETILAILDILFYLAILGGGIYFTVTGLPEEYKDLQVLLYLFYPVFIGVSVLSFFLARYAYRNFYDVVSIRMLYQNSNASVFEVKWRYALDRFCKITYSMILGIFSILTFVFACYTGFKESFI